MSGHGSYGVAVLLGAAPDAERALRERTGGIRGNTRGHLKHIGAMLLIESRMVGRAQIGDKASHRAHNRRLDQYEAFTASRAVHVSLIVSDAAAQLHCALERSISLHSSSLNDRIERVV